MEANEEIHQKEFTFRNNQNQEIVIKFSIKNENVISFWFFRYVINYNNAL